MPSSRFTRQFLIAPLVLVFTALGSANAQSSDCVSLKVLSAHGGELPTYMLRSDPMPVIGAKAGEPFSLLLRNQCDSRLLARTFVDGLNVVDGKTRSNESAGYVLEPFQKVHIQGWRKSNAQVAQFYFTSPSDSYASRMYQSTRDLGVIEVHVFEQQLSRSPAYRAQSKESSAGASEVNGANDAPGVLSAKGPSSESKATDSSYSEQRLSAQSARSAVGTGHGERMNSPAKSVSFQAKPYALQITRLRYILEQDLKREMPRSEFAPDPLR